jgi:hypothetical protein
MYKGNKQHARKPERRKGKTKKQKKYILLLVEFVSR